MEWRRMKELNVINLNKVRRNDLFLKKGSFMLLWGIPIAFVILSEALMQAHEYPIVYAPILITSTAWFGAGCFINGRICGRIHCKIDGMAMPVLSLLGLLSFFSLLPLSWNYYLGLFFLILVVSFISECFGRVHTPRRQ